MAEALQFQIYPASEMSTDERSGTKVKRTDTSNESEQEVETDPEEIKEKKFLDDAMRSILDPSTTFIKYDDDVHNIKSHLEDLDKSNITLDVFIEEMDRLSLEICKTSQSALWSYATDINNGVKKNKMVRMKLLCVNNIFESYCNKPNNSAVNPRATTSTKNTVLYLFSHY